MKRHALIFWIAIVLAAVGIISAICKAIFGNFTDMSSLLIPVIVFGAVFLLYKFPPRRYGKKPKVKPSARTMEKVASAKRNHPAGKRKHYPFRVIEGSKGKNDDQQPKYH